MLCFGYEVSAVKAHAPKGWSVDGGTYLELLEILGGDTSWKK
jgi:hypothetical protein